MMNTNARSPTGTPPASIFPSVFNRITYSKWGMTVCSSSAIACSGDGGSGPRAPSTRYCIAFLPEVSGAEIDGRTRASEQPLEAPAKQYDFVSDLRNAGRAIRYR
jgi:hypothetical protein